MFYIINDWNILLKVWNFTKNISRDSVEAFFWPHDDFPATSTMLHLIFIFIWYDSFLKHSSHTVKNSPIHNKLLSNSKHFMIVIRSILLVSRNGVVDDSYQVFPQDLMKEIEIYILSFNLRPWSLNMVQDLAHKPLFKMPTLL